MAGNGVEVAKFWATLGVKTNKSDLVKVDAFLKEIQVRFAKSKTGLSLKLHNFTVDQKALNLALRDSFLIASRQVSFEISRFTVNHAALNGALRGASLGGGGGSKGSSAGAMGAGAMLSRAFLPIAAVAAGGYGLSSLNKLNQKVVAGELQSQAVVTQAGGTIQQGTDSFNWLKYQANRIGFNYLDAVPSYNNTLAGLTHAGMSVKQGQNIFKGFSEQGRALKLDAVHQKRLFYAISEVADMNQLQKRQLNMINLALPGAKSIFSEAYQTQTGGKLKGQAAEAALLGAIHAGQVNAGILTPAANIASARATGNAEVWNNATHASVAEQARYQNSIANLATVASNSGVEEGFQRIFRTLNDGLSESGALVARLAEGFNEATKSFRVLALLPQSFNRMLDGKDSFISKLIGPDEVAKWQENIKAITDTANSLVQSWEIVKKSLGNSTWADYLKTTLKEINALLTSITTTINATKWLGEEVASRLNGPAANDPVRLSDSIDRESGYLGRLQKQYYKASDNGDTDAMDRIQETMTSAQDHIQTWQAQYAQATGGTTTVTVGDIYVNSNASNPADVATAVKEHFDVSLSNALIDANLHNTKAGR